MDRVGLAKPRAKESKNIFICSMHTQLGLSLLPTLGKSALKKCNLYGFFAFFDLRSFEASIMIADSHATCSAAGKTFLLRIVPLVHN